MTPLEEAKKYATNKTMDGYDHDRRQQWFTRTSLNDAFIAGVQSKFVKLRVLNAVIVKLESLESRLKIKTTALKYLETKHNKQRIQSKVSGNNLALEEIRRDLIELRNQIKEIEDGD